ncbi:MAG: prohibitin family protein [bacterium]|nr:prohibitin family protein [bacterium]
MGGISSIISTAGLIGFLLFLLGIGLIVVSASQGRPVRGGVLLAVVGLIVGILLTIIGQGILVLEPTEVAVVINTLSGDVLEPRRGGTSVILPVVQQVAFIYPTTQQDLIMSATPDEGDRAGDDSVEARTSDGQSVNLDVTVLYRVNPEEVNTLYLRYREGNFEDAFVRTLAREIVRDAATAFTAEDLYGEARVQLANNIQEELGRRLPEAGLVLDDVAVRDTRFTEVFTNAVEQRQVAEQLRAQAAIEAETARTRAAGEAEANRQRAQGEADAIVTRANAEAEALRVVSEQIASNPTLIQYLYVQNLSDNVNLALIPSNSPFLFDINSLLAGQGVTPQATPTTPGGGQ